MAKGPKKPIPNKKGRTNWVEEAGGLPTYIRRIAEHLHGQGHSISAAIAMAVNTVKRWAKGTNHNGGKLKPQTVAKAAAAVAQWEKKKASANAKRLKEAPDLKATGDELAEVGAALAGRLTIVEGMLLSCSSDPTAGAVRAAKDLLEGREARLYIDRRRPQRQAVDEVREGLEAERELLAELVDALGLAEAQQRGKKGSPKPIPDAKPPKPKKDPALAAPKDLPTDGDPARTSHLQNRLNSLGKSLVVDGNFGPKTEAAVLEFQREAGLLEDGIVGPKTSGALRKGGGEPPANEDELPPPDPTEVADIGDVETLFKGQGVGDPDPDVTVQDLQDALVELGYEIDSDGRFGPQTEGAVKRMQRKFGLKTDGIVGPKTQRTLAGAVSAKERKEKPTRDKLREAEDALAVAEDGYEVVRLRARIKALRESLEVEEAASQVTGHTRRGPRGKITRVDPYQREVAMRVFGQSSSKLKGGELATLASMAKPWKGGKLTHTGSGDVNAAVLAKDSGEFKLDKPLDVTSREGGLPWFGTHKLFIDVPEGFPVVDLADFGNAFPGEQAHVLLPHTRLRVTKREGDELHVRAEYPPKEDTSWALPRGKGEGLEKRQKVAVQKAFGMNAARLGVEDRAEIRAAMKPLPKAKTLYRMYSTDSGNTGSIQSWTENKNVAKGFNRGKIEARTFPAGTSVFAMPGTHFANEREVLVDMDSVPKKSLREGFDSIVGAVLHDAAVLQEAAGASGFASKRGGTRRIFKRLADGTFAPAGRGTVRHAGQAVSLLPKGTRALTKHGGITYATESDREGWRSVGALFPAHDVDKDADVFELPSGTKVTKDALGLLDEADPKDIPDDLLPVARRIAEQNQRSRGFFGDNPRGTAEAAARARALRAEERERGVSEVEFDFGPLDYDPDDRAFDFHDAKSREEAMERREAAMAQRDTAAEQAWSKRSRKPGGDAPGKPKPKPQPAAPAQSGLVDFHDERQREAVAAPASGQGRAKMPPAYYRAKAAREEMAGASERGKRDRQRVAKKVFATSPHRMEGLDRVRLAKFAKPIGEQKTLFHGSTEDFLKGDVGDTVSLTRPVSFTGREKIATEFGHNVVYHIDTPAEAKVYRPGDFAEVFGMEDEYNLLKNTKVKITKKERGKDGKLHVHGKVIRGGGSKLSEAEVEQAIREWLVEAVRSGRLRRELVESFLQREVRREERLREARMTYKRVVA